MNLRIALIDNDYVIRASSDLQQNGKDDPFRKFLRQIRQELVPGQTAFLEIEDPQTDTITYEITQTG